MFYGYARVSTDDQDAEMQRLALRNAGCQPRNIYTDHGVSGKFIKRPQLSRCLSKLQSGDVLLVWKLDRLGRNVLDLIETVEGLKRRNVHFRSLTESMINTSSPQGELIFQIFAAFSQFERSLLLERTSAGRKLAKAKGTKFGPRFKLDAFQKSRALKLLTEGDSCEQVARSFGVSRSTLYRALGKLPPRVSTQPARPRRPLVEPAYLSSDSHLLRSFGERSRGDVAWDLIAATDPEQIDSFEIMLGQSQAEVIAEMIDYSCWSSRLTKYANGKGSQEERRLALINAYYDQESASVVDSGEEEERPFEDFERQPDDEPRSN